MINSVWYVVDAINAYSEFQISYPADHEEQQAIAEGFRRKSAANFDCCAGAIDGILVWIHKPSQEECTKAGCSDGKFFCGRKHKFGLNYQGFVLLLSNMSHVYEYNARRVKVLLA
jgi:hypothetical protein